MNSLLFNNRQPLSHIKVEDDNDIIIDLDAPTAPSYCWDEDMRKLLSQVVNGKTLIEDILKQYTLSLQKEMQISMDKVKLKEKIITHLNFFKLHYMDVMNDYMSSSNYYELMEDILALYCTLELDVVRKKHRNRKKMKKKTKDEVTERIFSVLAIFLGDKEMHMLHVLLKLKYTCTSEACCIIMKRIFKQVLFRYPVQCNSDESFSRKYIIFLMCKELVPAEEHEMMDLSFFHRFKRPKESIKTNKVLSSIFTMDSASLVDTCNIIMDLKGNIVTKYFNYMKRKKRTDELAMVPNDISISFGDMSVTDDLLNKAEFEISETLQDATHQDNSPDAKDVIDLDDEEETEVPENNKVVFVYSSGEDSDIEMKYMELKKVKKKKRMPITSEVIDLDDDSSDEMSVPPENSTLRIEENNVSDAHGQEVSASDGATNDQSVEKVLSESLRNTVDMSIQQYSPPEKEKPTENFSESSLDVPTITCDNLITDESSADKSSDCSVQTKESLSNLKLTDCSDDQNSPTTEDECSIFEKYNKWSLEIETLLRDSNDGISDFSNSVMKFNNSLMEAVNSKPTEPQRRSFADNWTRVSAKRNVNRSKTQSEKDTAPDITDNTAKTIPTNGLLSPERLSFDVENVRSSLDTKVCQTTTLDSSKTNSSICSPLTSVDTSNRSSPSLNSMSDNKIDVVVNGDTGSHTPDFSTRHSDSQENITDEVMLVDTVQTNQKESAVEDMVVDAVQPAPTLDVQTFDVPQTKKNNLDNILIEETNINSKNQEEDESMEVTDCVDAQINTNPVTEKTKTDSVTQTADDIETEISNISASEKITKNGVEKVLLDNSVQTEDIVPPIEVDTAVENPLDVPQQNEIVSDNIQSAKEIASDSFNEDHVIANEKSDELIDQEETRSEYTVEADDHSELSQGKELVSDDVVAEDKIVDSEDDQEVVSKENNHDAAASDVASNDLNDTFVPDKIPEDCEEDNMEVDLGVASDCRKFVPDKISEIYQQENLEIVSDNASCVNFQNEKYPSENVTRDNQSEIPPENYMSQVADKTDPPENVSRHEVLEKNYPPETVSRHEVLEKSYPSEIVSRHDEVASGNEILDKKYQDHILEKKYSAETAPTTVILEKNYQTPDIVLGENYPSETISTNEVLLEKNYPSEIATRDEVSDNYQVTDNQQLPNHEYTSNISHNCNGDNDLNQSLIHFALHMGDNNEEPVEEYRKPSYESEPCDESNVEMEEAEYEDDAYDNDSIRSGEIDIGEERIEFGENLDSAKENEVNVCASMYSVQNSIGNFRAESAPQMKFANVESYQGSRKFNEDYGNVQTMISPNSYQNEAQQSPVDYDNYQSRISPINSCKSTSSPYLSSDDHFDEDVTMEDANDTVIERNPLNSDPPITSDLQNDANCNSFDSGTLGISEMSISPRGIIDSSDDNNTIEEPKSYEFYKRNQIWGKLPKDNRSGLVYMNGSRNRYENENWAKKPKEVPYLHAEHFKKSYADNCMKNGIENGKLLVDSIAPSSSHTKHRYRYGQITPPSDQNTDESPYHHQMQLSPIPETQNHIYKDNSLSKAKKYSKSSGKTVWNDGVPSKRNSFSAINENNCIVNDSIHINETIVDDDQSALEDFPSNKNHVFMLSPVSLNGNGTTQYVLNPQNGAFNQDDEYYIDKDHQPKNGLSTVKIVSIAHKPDNHSHSRRENPKIMYTSKETISLSEDEYNKRKESVSDHEFQDSFSGPLIKINGASNHHYDNYNLFESEECGEGSAVRPAWEKEKTKGLKGHHHNEYAQPSTSGAIRPILVKKHNVHYGDPTASDAHRAPKILKSALSHKNCTTIEDEVSDISSMSPPHRSMSSSPINSPPFEELSPNMYKSYTMAPQMQEPQPKRKKKIHFNLPDLPKTPPPPPAEPQPTQLEPQPSLVENKKISLNVDKAYEQLKGKQAMQENRSKPKSKIRCVGVLPNDPKIYKSRPIVKVPRYSEAQLLLNYRNSVLEKLKHYTKKSCLLTRIDVSTEKSSVSSPCRVPESADFLNDNPVTGRVDYSKLISDTSYDNSDSMGRYIGNPPVHVGSNISSPEKALNLVLPSKLDESALLLEFSNSPKFFQDSKKLVEACLNEKSAEETTDHSIDTLLNNKNNNKTFFSNNSNFYTNKLTDNNFSYVVSQSKVANFSLNQSNEVSSCHVQSNYYADKDEELAKKEEISEFISFNRRSEDEKNENNGFVANYHKEREKPPQEYLYSEEEMKAREETEKISERIKEYAVQLNSVAERKQNTEEVNYYNGENSKEGVNEAVNYYNEENSKEANEKVNYYNEAKEEVHYYNGEECKESKDAVYYTEAQCKEQGTEQVEYYNGDGCKDDKEGHYYTEEAPKEGVNYFNEEDSIETKNEGIYYSEEEYKVTKNEVIYYNGEERQKGKQEVRCCSREGCTGELCSCSCKERSAETNEVSYGSGEECTDGKENVVYLLEESKEAEDEVAHDYSSQEAEKPLEEILHNNKAPGALKEYLNNFYPDVDDDIDPSKVPVRVPLRKLLLSDIDPILLKELRKYNMRTGDAAVSALLDKLKAVRETRLPFKKRRMSVNLKQEVVVETKQQEEISYPATPMISIAEIEVLNKRCFKTPAERKEMPSVSNPIYTPAPPQFFQNPNVQYQMASVPFAHSSCPLYYPLHPVLIPFNPMNGNVVPPKPMQQPPLPYKPTRRERATKRKNENYCIN